MAKSMFDKFNKAVDLDGLKQDVANAETGNDFPQVPVGTYEVELVSLEVKLTKNEPKRPMLAASFAILEGKYRKSRLFFNRVLFGTKNDASMIKGAVTFLENLESDVDVSFSDYDQFAEAAMDVLEAVSENKEYIVEYDPDAFNSVTIKEVFNLED